MPELDPTFGAYIRALREKKEISLRRFAEDVGISPTYLSKVERGEFPPPAEDKIQAIAEALGENPDQLLALAGKVASDLPEIIRQHPREMATFLRTASGLSAEEIKRLSRELEQRKGITEQ